MKEYKNALRNLRFESDQSKGRIFTEDDEDRCLFGVMDPFDIDAIKIKASKAFRRLSDKTQVFCNSSNINVRTRASHTAEVASLAKMIAEILGLNASLCEAIAYGHDIGHVPYGHLGEEFLSRQLGVKFCHNIFGAIVAQELERKGWGLNISGEVEIGIIKHSMSKKNNLERIKDEHLLEYDVVMFADKIAYVFADINDAKRYELIKRGQENKLIKFFGKNHREGVYSCVKALVKESSEYGKISFSNSEIAKKFFELRKWMFENVYHKVSNSNTLELTIMPMICEFLAHEPKLKEYDPYLLFALMTDSEVNRLAKLRLESTKLNFSHLDEVGFMEALPYIKGNTIIDML